MTVDFSAVIFLSLQASPAYYVREDIILQSVNLNERHGLEND